MPRKKDEISLIILCSLSNRDLLEKIPQEMGASFDTVFSVDDIYHHPVVTKKYHGFVLDTANVQKLEKHQRTIIQRMQQAFPMLFLDTTTLYQKENDPQWFWSDRFVERFVEAVNKFSPRPVRNQARVRLPLHGHICMASHFKNSLRVVTENISEGGAFLLLNESERFETGDMAWVKISEICEDNPIKASVRWVSKWGENGKFPGVGVEFVRIETEHKEKIKQILEQAKNEQESSLSPEGVVDAI
ncbi:PilZ domain-containing protein [Geoalkalibacter subterraneus]|uniref:PilZ domain-containing protein n=1 Tax=Geoalkalibacter subterraneus TaxID=483547 RepID=A0A0B5FTU9_9BACT|nr:PilZ domain-containing protein [Geoalkalibacter subterraneus]AJF08114.1 hypothetical protein GSUB_16515 [Geoalkalibacter subterraneus]